MNDVKETGYRIILADDHRMFRQGIQHILQKVPGIEVVGEASDGVELLKLLGKTKAHLVILDISMPNLSGIEVIKGIKAIQADVRILMLTMHQNTEYFYHAVSGGADGYLLKADADTELLRAIETLREGSIYVSPILRKELAQGPQPVDVSGKATDAVHLTNRQNEILKLVTQGKSNADMAEILKLSVRTVEHHRAKLMKRLNLKNTAELVRYSLQKSMPAHH